MSARPLSDKILRRFRSQVLQPFDRRVKRPLRRRFNANRVYRPIFVAGASGSGTSFIALAVGQRFDCAGVIYESNFQVEERSFLYVPDLEVFDSVADYLHAMGPHDSWSETKGRQDMLEMYRENCWGPSETVVDKGPDTNLLRAEFLGRCFPDALFLLIYRNPVANVEGLRRKWGTFRDDTLDEAIRFYRETHERFLDAVESFPDRVAAVNYDSMVEHPEEVMTAIGNRLDLRTAVRPRRLESRANVEGMGIRNVRKNQIGVITDANRRAIERLPAEEADAIRVALEPLRKRLKAAPFNV